MQTQCSCTICLDYRASDGSSPLNAKGEKESEKKEEGEGKGIKKKSAEKKKEKKKAKKIDKTKKLLIKQLTALEVEKGRFTKHKIRLNKLRAKRHDVIDQEIATLFQETRAIYENVLLLYHQMLLDYFARQQLLTSTLEATETEYAEVKRKLVDVRTDLEAQDEKAKEILARWTNFLENRPEPSEQHKEGDKRLTRNERLFVKRQAAFLQKLYNDVIVDTEANADSEERKKALVKQKAHLKAKKNTLSEELRLHIEEDRKLRGYQSKFKNVNDFLTKEIEIAQQGEEEEEEEEEEEAEEFSVLGTIEEEEEEDEGVLSETEESDTLQKQINEITTKLMDGDYAALNAKFNQPHHDTFLVPLIQMYREEQWLVVTEFALDYITLLLDERASLIAQLYDVLVAPTIDYGSFVEHITTAQPPLHIREAEKKVLMLVAGARNLSKLELLKAIRAFVNDELSPVDEREGVEGPALWVSDTFDVAEAREATILLAGYDILDMDSALSRHSCVYRAIERDTFQDVIIKIVPELGERNVIEDRVYESLAHIEGFAELREFFRLDSFPTSSFTPCPRISKAALRRPVHVYVTEYLPLSFRVTVTKFNREEKLCALFELLVTLRDAKKKYGIQHNQLDLENIRFREAAVSPRYYSLSERMEQVKCVSAYRVTLIDLGMASLNLKMSPDQRSLLSGSDYASFYRLATRIPDMYVSDTLRTSLPEGESAPFDLLMTLVANEMTK